SHVEAAVVRRAAAALERPPRRHEPVRAAADAGLPGGALYAPTAPPSGGEAGDHGLGADPRAGAVAVGRSDRARRLVRRAPLALGRPEDPRPDAARALRGHVQGG